MIRATIIYFIVSTVAALATPLVGQRTPAVILAVGALVLIASLVRTVSDGRRPPDRPQSVAMILLAVFVGAVAAFLAFVVMVNIWERLGIPH